MTAGSWRRGSGGRMTRSSARGSRFVAVQGLDELRRELRRLDDETIINELKDTNQAVARDVVGWAQQRAGSLGPMERRAAASMTASRAQKGAQVRLGGARAPFAAGAEFGAYRGRQRVLAGGRTVTGWNQFNPWRGNGADAGYFLYPAIRAHTAELVETYAEAIDRIVAKAFPD